jgi:hypothetical protein
MEIVTFIPATAVNPYTEDIETLLAATNENPNAAGVFTVKNSDAIKAKKQIADAANAVGKTASFGTRTVVESTETRFVVKLTHKHKARRNAERESAAKGADNNTVSIHDIIDQVSAEFIAAKEAESIDLAVSSLDPEFTESIELETKATPKPRATRK